MHLQRLILICFAVGISWALLRLLARAPLRRVMVEGAFAGYLVAVAFVVFFTTGGLGRAESAFSWELVNLVPLRTIMEFAGDEDVMLAVRQIAGNVVLFVPLGALLPAMTARFRSVAALLPVAAMTSVSIEILQLLFGLLGLASRSTDIDDVILNTIGALVGWALWRVLHSAWRALAPSRQDEDLHGEESGP